MARSTTFQKWIAALAPVIALSLAHRDAHSGEAAASAIAGKVVSVDGKVLVRQDEGNSPALDLKPGDQVREGDVINTSSNGKVKLLLEDKTILDLGPSALFKVQKFKPNAGGNRQVDLAMAYGTVRASVSRPIAPGGKFQIRTRTATMGVRGTEFIVQTAIDPGKGAPGAKGGSSGGRPQATKVTVVQGKVEVAAPVGIDTRALAAVPKPGVMLTAGTQLTASADAPMSKPVNLSAGELSAVTTATKLVDTTFQKAVNLNLASDNGNGSNGNSGGGADSAAGQATRTAIAQAITTSPTAPTQMTTSQFIGGFSATTIPRVVPPNLVGGFSTIQVVVK